MEDQKIEKKEPKKNHKVTLLLLGVLILIGLLFIGKGVWDILGEKENQPKETQEEKENKALKIGKEKWDYAYILFWGGDCEETREAVKKNFASDATITAVEPYNSYTLKEFIREGQECKAEEREAKETYRRTSLIVKKIEENKLEFVAVSEFCESVCEAESKTTETVEKPFILVKEGKKWVIQSFYLPN